MPRSPAAAAPTPASPSSSTPSCPAASQIGTALTGAGPAPTPSTYAARSTRRPLQRRAPRLVVMTRRSRAPMTSATSSSGRPSTSTRDAPRSPRYPIRCPRSSKGSRFGFASIRIELDRQEFALNPTNCDPFSVSATAMGTKGRRQPRAPPSRSPTAALPFDPKLGLPPHGRGQRGKNPRSLPRHTAGKNEANGKIAPRSSCRPTELLEQRPHLTMSAPEWSSPRRHPECPRARVLGHAKAETPLLEKPLRGPGLPALLGQGPARSGPRSIWPAPHRRGRPHRRRPRRSPHDLRRRVPDVPARQRIAGPSGSFKGAHREQRT